MDKAFLYISKLIELLKPKFYNRLTWTIVIAGLSLMIAPLWSVVINKVLTKEFNFSITGAADVTWGFLLCALGLVYHVFSTGLHEFALKIVAKEKESRVYAHDASLFARLAELLPEDYLINLVAGVETEHAIRWGDFRKIETFVRVASESGNSFITPKIREKNEYLISVLGDLVEFINKNFDEYPYGQAVTNFKMCLAPQLNCDRAGSWEDGPRYDALVEQMMSDTQRTITAYKEWRASVKEFLYI
jgi:hypothetical protein